MGASLTECCGAVVHLHSGAAYCAKCVRRVPELDDPAVKGRRAVRVARERAERAAKVAAAKKLAERARRREERR